MNTDSQMDTFALYFGRALLILLAFFIVVVLLWSAMHGLWLLHECGFATWAHSAPDVANCTAGK